MLARSCPSPDSPRSRLLLGMLAGLVLTAACTRDAQAPPEDLAEADGPARLVIPPASELIGAPQPVPGTQPLACEDDDMCRVWRPSAWGPRVECCYEYGCELDFEPIHADEWALLRAWREANPVDCTAELQEGRPCLTDIPACPFETAPPMARCLDGQCGLALPPRWPVVAPEAQTCSVASECVAVRASVFVTLERCCAGHCPDLWAALNREGLRVLEDWLDRHAPRCAEVREALDCDPATPCPGDPPPVRCRDGFCALQ